MKAYTQNDVLVLAPNTNLIASHIEEIRNFFLAQLKEFPNEKSVTLDVKGVDVVDSLGVNLIIGLYKETNANSKELKIINAGEKFMKIANFFRFPSILTIENE